MAFATDGGVVIIYLSLSHGKPCQLSCRNGKPFSVSINSNGNTLIVLFDIILMYLHFRNELNNKNYSSVLAVATPRVLPRYAHSVIQQPYELLHKGLFKFKALSILKHHLILRYVAKRHTLRVLTNMFVNIPK